MTTDERLIALNCAARSIALIEAWHNAQAEPEVWLALVSEARVDLRPAPGAHLSAALTTALTTMIAEIQAAETPHPRNNNEGEN